MTGSQKQKETILFVIWAQSVIATLGSLFFSEVLRYIPCELCWFSRVLMYPLVIIYGVAMIKKNISIAFPGIILSGIGVVVAFFHYLTQKVPALSETAGSCGIVPCNVEYINYFGFITIPFLALVAFIIIFTLHILLLKKNKGE